MYEKESGLNDRKNKVISRIFFCQIVFFLFTVQCEKIVTQKKNSSNQLFSIFFHKNVTFTKFLSKKCDSEFP